MIRKRNIEKLAMIVAVCLAVLCVLGCSNEADEPEIPAPIAVQSVTLYTSTITLEPNKSYILGASVTPYNADDKTVKWWSSDETVATVDDDGMVTAVKEGTATITAKAGDRSATCMVTVKRHVVEVEDITLDVTMLKLEIGKTWKLTATVTPDNADDKTVTWSSPYTSIATVSDDGTVTAVGGGVVTITARAGGKTATCEINVRGLFSTTHIHEFIGDVCEWCGDSKPIMKDGIIDDSGELTKYNGNEMYVSVPEGVTGIRKEAFRGCSSLRSVTIPSSVTSIGEYAFSGCTGLTSVTISEGVTCIGDSAFRGCDSLTSVTIPGSVASIGDVAFGGCASLTSVTISDGVTSIGEYAFNGCDSLTSVTIPGSVASIGDVAFGGCASL
ncbi:MAG: leucine-rich repeat protein, partial [Treponemataceae bacterium]|nr:leucine-rich repeat protein [Treponemataceae bacterium]